MDNTDIIALNADSQNYYIRVGVVQRIFIWGWIGVIYRERWVFGIIKGEYVCDTMWKERERS